jgi:hypothetical protein
VRNIYHDSGLSDALGAIILVAVVSMGVAIVGVSMLSNPTPQKIPSLDADFTTIDHSIILRHEGGDTLQKEDVSFIMNGNDIKNFFKNMDGTPWSRWSVGDTLRYNVPAGHIVPDSLQLVYTRGTSPQVILSLGKPMINIRVNCGDGVYTDKKNNSWSADQQYIPGGWGYSGNRNSYSVGNPIANTMDPTLYQTESWFSGGDGKYRFTLPNGNYKVTLKFAEIYNGINPGNPRIFSVVIEGNRVITDLYLLSTAGLYSATDGTYHITVHDGILDIDFIKGRENPKISAIEIVSE